MILVSSFHFPTMIHLYRIRKPKSKCRLEIKKVLEYGDYTQIKNQAFVQQGKS